MARRNNSNNNITICAMCDSANLASVCTVCVNYRLNEHYARLKAMRNLRDSRYLRLREKLEAKRKADDQLNWRVSKNEKIKKLKDQLSNLQKQLSQAKTKVQDVSTSLKLRYSLLDEARATLEKNRVELLEKFYPNLIYTQGLGLMAITSEQLHKQSVVIKQICKLFPMRRVNSDAEKKEGYSGPYDQICFARLPRGLDPHSVPSEELAASLGYVVQLLNLVIPALGAPSLHNSGFAGSCSRVWQRDSYWDARPSSQSKEYQLFIPRKNFCSSAGDSSTSSSSFGITSLQSEKRQNLTLTDSSIERTGSFNSAASSLHSMEKHKDLQKGISLLKKSVACVTAYCYNSLGLEVPPEASTFEAFGRMLGVLSSSRELRSVISRKMAWSRSDKHGQLLNRSVWNVNSSVSSVTGLVDSTLTTFMQPSSRENHLLNSAASFLYSPEETQYGKTESMIVEEWDIIEHPKFPPPPSQNEDVEHWTRAMFIDATTKK